jgi:hypothetical protein
MDRRLANKNLRSALIATAVIFVMFGVTWIAALIYVA